MLRAYSLGFREKEILTKRTFWWLGVLWSFLGSYLAQGLERLFLLWFVLGLLPEGDREGTKERIINKTHFLGECDV